MYSTHFREARGRPALGAQSEERGYPNNLKLNVPLGLKVTSVLSFGGLRHRRRVPQGAVALPIFAQFHFDRDRAKEVSRSI